jgi:lipopolysaccharide/colanic/teichoic acid biosynthesis glycosyltransferase
VKCSGCGFENAAGMKFCGECGGALAFKCRSCGFENLRGMKFCGECGKSLADPGAPVRSRDPRSYTPHHLAEKILTSRSALEGERKQVTVLFVDVKGSMWFPLRRSHRSSALTANRHDGMNVPKNLRVTISRILPEGESRDSDVRLIVTSVCGRLGPTMFRRTAESASSFASFMGDRFFTIQKLVLPALCFALAFNLNEAYDLRRGSVSAPETRIARAFALTALILFPLYLAIPSLRPSDRQVLTLFVLLIASTHLYFSLRSRIRSIFTGARTSPSRNVLVFGTSAVARAAARELERIGYTVIRFTESDGDGNPGQSLRTISRATKVIAETKPVRIVVCLRSPLEELPMCELFEQQIEGVPVETGHEAYERLTGKIFLDERTPLHLLFSHAGLRNRVYGATKRFVSAVVAAMALVVALPVMALIGLWIYVTEGGPVLFVQDRVGLHGRPFRLLKFRSMRIEKGTSSEWECDNEERITPLGRWLRRLHLDELPQLWNILCGDMDLVGPRPHPVSNHELFARSIPYYSLRSLVRPGLTGWAQVRQGYAHDLPGEIEKMRYDLYAIARSSLRRDLWVLFATAKIVLVGHSPLPGSGGLKELRVSHSPPRRALGANKLPRLATRSARDDPFQPGSEGKGMANEVEGKVVASPSAPEPEVVMHMMWDPTEWLEAFRRRAARFAATSHVFYPAMASGRRQGFPRLLAAVVVLSMAAGTLRLIAQTRINTRANPPPPATAMRAPEPTSPTVAATAMAAMAREPTLPVTAVATGASDLASRDAAAAWAKAAVQRYENSNARVLKSVIAKRIGGGSFVDGIERPRYEAEVHVEIPRSFNKPIQRKYSLTLQYVGSGEWEIEYAVGSPGISVGRDRGHRNGSRSPS